MWQGHLLPSCTEGPGLLSGWDKAQLLGTWLSGSPGQCFIPMRWLVTGGLRTPCLPGPWVVAAWGQPSPAVPVAPLSPLPSSLKNELEKEIPLGTYQYAKSLKDTILLGPNAKGSSSWAAMRSVLCLPLAAPQPRCPRATVTSCCPQVAAGGPSAG